jgi:enolase-phosphatase E1
VDSALHQQRHRQGIPAALHGAGLHPAPDRLALKEVGAVLLDIEGTTTPIAFVHHTLFGYARARVSGFLERHWSEPGIKADVARLEAEHAAELSQPAPPPWCQDVSGVTAYVHWLMEQDRKSTGLKSLQGKIWEEGYRSGELESEVYPDVLPALERWRGEGIDVAIFSSGSVQAQQALFRHTAAGDLTPFIRAYFDTMTGPKNSPESYTRIAASLECAPTDVCFVSDIVAELDAARAAGMRTAWCVRQPGAVHSSSTHPIVQAFDRLTG